MSLHITEPLADGLSRVWDVHEVMIDVHTEYQHVVIGRTAQGVTLFCDNERQSTQDAQLVYHEALTVPAMLLAGTVRNVLVIGCSEGVVSQLALAAGAEHIDHVDIDDATVRLCAEHLPYGYDAAELAEAEQGTGPVRMHYRDGGEFVLEADREYDVVVIDLPDENADPEAQHNRLYGEAFLRRCRDILSPHGVVACQSGCPTLWRQDTLQAAWDRFRNVFPTVVYFGSDEHEWAFLCGGVEQVESPVDAMVDQLGRTRYQPRTIDIEALRGNTVPPHSLRARPSAQPEHGG